MNKRMGGGMSHGKAPAGKVNSGGIDGAKRKPGNQHMAVNHKTAGKVSPKRG